MYVLLIFLSQQDQCVGHNTNVPSGNVAEGAKGIAPVCHQGL
jgi:hypothetical protein